MNKTEAVSGMRKEILSIALPSFLEVLFLSFTSIIDSKMVSGLGVEAISAISVTNQPKLFIFSIFTAINVVVSVLVAQNLGKHNQEKASSIFVSALTLCGVLSIVLGVLCALFATPLMRLCSGQEDTLADSVLYFRILMLSMIFNNLFMLNAAAFRGFGKTSLLFYSQVISSVVNIIGNYLLIEGRFGFPALGILGAAIATVFGTFVAWIFTLLYMLRTRDAFISLQYCIRHRIRASRESVGEIWQLWKHAIVENLLSRLGFVLTSSITARIGSFSMSVYSVGQNLMTVNSAVGTGLQSAAMALIGRSKGEKDEEKIRQYSRRLLLYALISSLVLSALYILLARPYGGLFSKDPVFILQASIVCYIVAAIAPLQNVKIVLSGLLQGVGNTRATKRAAIISVTVVQTVTSFILTLLLDFGLWGAWASIFLSQATWFLTLSIFYQRSKKGL